MSAPRDLGRDARMEAQVERIKQAGPAMYSALALLVDAVEPCIDRDDVDAGKALAVAREVLKLAGGES